MRIDNIFSSLMRPASAFRPTEAVSAVAGEFAGLRQQISALDDDLFHCSLAGLSAEFNSLAPFSEVKLPDFLHLIDCSRDEDWTRGQMEYYQGFVKIGLSMLQTAEGFFVNLEKLGKLLGRDFLKEYKSEAFGLYGLIAGSKMLHFKKERFSEFDDAEAGLAGLTLYVFSLKLKEIIDRIFAGPSTNYFRFLYQIRSLIPTLKIIDPKIQSILQNLHRQYMHFAQFLLSPALSILESSSPADLLGTISLNTQIRESIALFKTTPIQFNPDFDAQFPVLDQPVIGLLVEELLKNTPRGSRVVISTGRSANQLFLKISDNGPGIRPRDLGWFEYVGFSSKPPFKKHENPVLGGLGLGMPKIISLLEFLCGNISVIAQNRKGTTFAIGLPLEELRISPQTSWPAGQPAKERP